MEKTTTIINGQPQNIPDTNRVVTWAGLLDYHNMLKNEIPKMGLNNSIAPEAKYSYAFGEGNTLQASASYSFVTGQDNTLKSINSCIIGYDNEISGDVDNFIIGVGNNTDDGGNFILGYSNYGQGNNYIIGHSNNFLDCDYNFIIGNNNTMTGPVENALILGRHLIVDADEQVWLGCYNDAYVSPSVFFGIGNGDSVRRSNLLYATREGEFYIPNGVLKTAFTFDDTVSFNGIVECNKQAKLINVDYKEDGSISFNNSTLKLNAESSTIKDDVKFSNAEQFNYAIYEKGFLRSMFAPYYQNEALWTVRSGQTYYAINFRPAQDLISQGSDFSLITPEEIHFYAGKGTTEDNWATIKCGKVEAEAFSNHSLAVYEKTVEPQDYFFGEEAKTYTFNLGTKESSMDGLWMIRISMDDSVVQYSYQTLVHIKEGRETNLAITGMWIRKAGFQIGLYLQETDTGDKQLYMNITLTEDKVVNHGVKQIYCQQLLKI